MMNLQMTGQAMRPFKVEITDNDGEEYWYYFKAKHMWRVMNFINRNMKQGGKFYGHNPKNTLKLVVTELILETLEGNRNWIEAK